MKKLETILHTRLPAAPSPRLDDILAGETSLSRDGYPIIAEQSFALFLREVPHLFRHGLALLDWLATIKRIVEASPYARGKDEASIMRAIEVMKTVVRTASITAPTDLWLVRQILSSYRAMGILDWFTAREGFSPGEIAGAFHLDEARLSFDLDLLHSRGYLGRSRDDRYHLAACPQAQEVFAKVAAFSADHQINWVAALLDSFSEAAGEPVVSRIDAFLHIDAAPSSHPDWVTSLFELEYGYRLVPVVLALRKAGVSSQLTAGAKLTEIIPRCPASLTAFLQDGGLLTAQGQVSALGDRIFTRGPGPFGIIYAYLDYMHRHADLLHGKREGVWVARGENVAASKDANARTFALINDSLDRFCAKHHFQFQVFIEHAVGYGEATRQRFRRDGESAIQYFGADLEDAAIDRAVESQRAGELPRNMEFIRNADIGDPQKLIQGVRAAGFEVRSAVMVVGNGFHEIRRQTNEKMIEVFRAYKDAGILLIFTEESALTNDDLLATGWNTYHAGFRYTHAISGQALRPAYDRDVTGQRDPVFSWRKCVAEAGYELLDEFSTHTRTIYPHPRPDGRNPAISVNYFCVPPGMV